jgi:hypothetical protein
MQVGFSRNWIFMKIQSLFLDFHENPDVQKFPGQSPRWWSGFS